jgi:hypothetical protein
VTGDLDHKEEYDLCGLRVLVEVLESYYGSTHETIVYEAARYPACNPSVHRVPLGKVPEAPVTLGSTLYLPPKTLASPDLQMLERLGIALSDLRKKVN